jgi:hypothetical protein
MQENVLLTHPTDDKLEDLENWIYVVEYKPIMKSTEITIKRTTQRDHT